MPFPHAARSSGGSTTEGLITLAANGTGTVPTSSSRIATTIINYGAGKVYFSSGTPDAATSPYIPSGSSITYGNGSAMNLLADATGARVGYFGEV